MNEVSKISEYFSELQAKTIRYTTKVSEDIQRIIAELDSGERRVCTQFGEEWVVVRRFLV